MTAARRHELLSTTLPDLRTRLDRMHHERRQALRGAPQHHCIEEQHTFDEEEQRLMRQIAEHEEQIRTYVMSPEPKSVDEVSIGHLVELELDEGEGNSLFSPQLRTILIVGDGEGDPKSDPQKVSYNTFLGMQLMRQSVGYGVEIKGANGGYYVIKTISIYHEPEMQTNNRPLRLVA